MVSVSSVLPFSEYPDVRERIDELFSREMLGAVLVGKFTGDYAAIKTTALLGVDVGYGLGIVVTIGLFVYWERLETQAKRAETELSSAQTTVSEY